MNAALGGLGGLLEGQARDTAQVKKRTSLIVSKLGDAEKVLTRIMESDDIKRMMSMIMTGEVNEMMAARDHSPSDYTVGTSDSDGESSHIAGGDFTSDIRSNRSLVEVSESPIVQVVSPTLSQATSPASPHFLQSRSQSAGQSLSASPLPQRMSVSVSSFVSEHTARAVPPAVVSPVISTSAAPYHYPSGSPLLPQSPAALSNFDLSVTCATQPSPLLLSKRLSRSTKVAQVSATPHQVMPSDYTQRSHVTYPTRVVASEYHPPEELQELTVPQEFTPSTSSSRSVSPQEWVDDLAAESESSSSVLLVTKCDVGTNTIPPTRSPKWSPKIESEDEKSPPSSHGRLSKTEHTARLVVPQLQLRDRSQTVKQSLPPIASSDVSPREHIVENMSFTSYSGQLLEAAVSPVASSAGSKSPREVRTLRNRFGQQPSEGYARKRRVSRTFSEEDKMKLLEKREIDERSGILDLQEEDHDILKRVHQLGLLNCTENIQRHSLVKSMRRSLREAKDSFDSEWVLIDFMDQETALRVLTQKDESQEWQRLCTNESQLIAWQKQHQKYVVGRPASHTPSESGLSVTLQSKVGELLVSQLPVAASGTPSIPRFTSPIDMKMLVKKALGRHWRQKTDNRKQPPRVYYVNIKSKESVWDLEARLASDKQKKYRKKVLGPDLGSRLYPAGCKKCRLWWKGIPYRWRCTSCGNSLYQPSSREQVASRFCFVCKSDISKTPPSRTPNCHACGRLCCSDCCNKDTHLVQLGYSGKTRLEVCDPCFACC